MVLRVWISTYEWGGTINPITEGISMIFSELGGRKYMTQIVKLSKQGLELHNSRGHNLRDSKGHSPILQATGNLKYALTQETQAPVNPSCKTALKAKQNQPWPKGKRFRTG